MSLSLKKLVVICFLALALGLVLMYLNCRLVKKSLPQTKGRALLPGLTADVRVYRDEFGVPHIFAENETDLFRALGYVTAQDRLWQMDLLRRTAKGRLSEIFGNTNLPEDKFVLTLGFYRTASQLMNTLSAKSRIILEAYSGGINEFLKSHKKKLPVEFTILTYCPQKWKPEDSLAIQRLLAWQLSSAWKLRLILTDLLENLDTKAVQELFPDITLPKPAEITPEQKALMESGTELAFITESISKFTGVMAPYTGYLSWAVAGEKSVTGKPLLATELSSLTTAPSVWYETHLKCPTIDVIGVSIPGIPAIIMGHNTTIAWGISSALVDNVSFFIKKINPANPYQYKNGNRWEEIKTVVEEIPIKNQDPIYFDVRLTQHGPVISDSLTTSPPKDYIVTLQWTGLESSDEFLAWYHLSKARNWQDFLLGLQEFKVPGLNFVYADPSGNIGYWCAARIPMQKLKETDQVQLLRTQQSEWSGYMPFEKLPHDFNPKEKYVIPPNFGILNSGYSARIEKINNLLMTKDKLSSEDFQRLQTECWSASAETLLPHVLRILKQKTPSEEMSKVFCSFLEEWNYQETAESIPATIFNVYLWHLLKNLYQDEMGERLYQEFLSWPGMALESTENLFTRGTTKWSNDLTTEEKTETLEDIIYESLKQTMEFLKKNLGEHFANWRWGRFYPILFRHVLSERETYGSREKWLTWFFNIRASPKIPPLAMAKSHAILSPGSPLESSVRQIMDLSNWDYSLSILAPGQSGQPMDKHYQDQMPLWLQGHYHPMGTKTIGDMLILKVK